MYYYLVKLKYLNLLNLKIKELEIELNKENFDIHSIISIVLS